MDNFRMGLILQREKEIKQEYKENLKLIDLYLKSFERLRKEETELKLLECKIVSEYAKK